LQFSRINPYVYTKQGSLMFATILNIVITIRASIQIVKAFVDVRERIQSYQLLTQKLDTLVSSHKIVILSSFFYLFHTV